MIQVGRKIQVGMMSVCKKTVIVKKRVVRVSRLREKKRLPKNLLKKKRFSFFLPFFCRFCFCFCF